VKGSLAAQDDGGIVKKKEKEKEEEEFAKVKYEVHFHCLDLGTQLAPVINNYMKLESEGKLQKWQQPQAYPRKVTLANPRAPDFGQPFKFDNFIDDKLSQIHSKTSTKSAEVINMWRGEEKVIDLVIGEGSIACGEISGKQQVLLFQVRGCAHVMTLKRKSVFLKEGTLMLIDADEGTPIVTQQLPVSDVNCNNSHGATLVIRNCLEAVA
jgi:hypothetical protein